MYLLNNISQVKTDFLTQIKENQDYLYDLLLALIIFIGLREATNILSTGLIPYTINYFSNIFNFISELLIIFICWNIFLLSIYIYQVTNNKKRLFLAVSLFFAGITTLCHVILIFNHLNLAPSSNSRILALSTRLIITTAILSKWLISKIKKDTEYYLHFSVLISSLFSLSITFFLFKLRGNISGFILYIRLILILLIIINIILYIIKDNPQKKKNAIKGLIFLLLNELIFFMPELSQSAEIFISHFYKLIAFVYFFRCLFGEEVTDGVLAQKELELKQERLNLKEKRIKDLRAQRHDFKNELQTIYTMIQLNKNEKAEKYIKELHYDLDNTDNPNTKTENEIDPVLLSKKKKAKEENIELTTKINVQLKEINLPQNKILKILFNLIDNAIDAVTELPKGDREINIKLMDKENKVNLIVCNNGPVIPEERIDDIFIPGFSTKGPDRGMGLYIIKTLIEDYGGKIEVKSNQQIGTKFICQLPKK